MMFLAEPSPIESSQSSRGFQTPVLPGDAPAAVDLMHKQVEEEIIRSTRLKTENYVQPEAKTKIAASLKYMMTHLNEPTKISKLSAMSGLSESNFFALFKSITGHSPMDLFIRARMRWAGKLLEGSPLLVKQIAGIIGYDDPLYFSRMFKSVYGISPKDYRIRKHQIDRHGPRAPKKELMVFKPKRQAHWKS